MTRAYNNIRHFFTVRVTRTASAKKLRRAMFTGELSKIEHLKQNVPMSYLDDCFELLSGCEIFCLRSNVRLEAKPKNAFKTPDTTAQFERMCK